MKNSERLEAAIEVMDREGWKRYSLYGPSGGHCLVGSVLATRWKHTEWVLLFDDNQKEAMVDEAAALIAPVVGNTSDSLRSLMVTFHNDSKLNCKEDAIDVLTDAAKYWRNRGE